MDSPQSVHDALERNTSQRPSAQRQVEPPPPDVERLGAVRGEPDALTKLARHGGSRLGDQLTIRIKRIHRRRARRRERCQPPRPTADIHYPPPAEFDDSGDSSRLDTFAITPMQIGSPEPGPVHRRARSSPATRRTRTHRWKASAHRADPNRARALPRSGRWEASGAGPRPRPCRFGAAPKSETRNRIGSRSSVPPPTVSLSARVPGLIP